MKNIFTLAACVLALQVSAQQVAHTPRTATSHEVEASRLLGMQEVSRAEASSLRGGGSTVVFFEDFANGFAGNNGVGPITVEDTSPETTIWQYVQAEGDGIYQDGTASGVQPPAGEFSTNIGGLNSESAANGWMIFDCDYYNTPVASGVEDVGGFLNLPTLDLSGLESVVITWDQYFRYCCFSFMPLFVEVSVDGGENWTSFEAGGSFIPSANVASANPLITGLDISCIAAGESAVDVRFAYKQTGPNASNYTHYYWGIDDIRIEANPVANELELVQLTNGDVFLLFEYRVTPMAQAIPEADGGVLAGVLYRNSGFLNQENCVITVDVLDYTGEVLSTTVTEPFTAPSFANNDNCPANPQDTLYIATGWEPEAEGLYTLRATMSSDSVADAGSLTMDMEYTECEFGHDNPAELDVELGPRFDDENDFFEPTGYGNRYTFHNEGTTVYGLAVAFGPSTSTGVDFEIRWMDQDPELSLADAPYEFAEFTSDANWAGTAANPVYYPLAFEDEIEVSVEGLASPGFYAGAVITEFDYEDLELTVLGNGNSDTDNSTIIYQQAGSGEFVWFTAQTATPAVRLITCPVVSVDVIGAYNGVHLQGNYPNPTAGETRFAFTSDWGGDFMIELRDLQGRLVDVLDLGSRPAGEHTVVYDASALSDGMYTYSLLTGDARVTKKMRVQH
ncbi:T9SS type A sorting domain-containing protein [Flavobacteriales bacterium]|nr:T9SS type A sorting domain-containing protein [Flavobacteriales bacterium]